MKKIVLCLVVAFLSLCFVIPAFADLVGDCYNCHTMHNSEQGAAVIGTTQPNLLRFDCLGCHAQNPGSGTKNWNGPGGSMIPQVAHADASGDLSGGNFNQSTARKVHSVIDVTAAGISPSVTLGENVNDQPPGIPHTSNRHVFTSEGATNAFDMFTCAGARGCHGTRSQALVAGTTDNGTANVWEIESRRTGIAAITGAHHANIDGEAKTSDGYNNLAAVHDGQIVADGYRFIVGLQGYENTAREYVDTTDHNEYYGNTDGIGGGCGACHVQDSAQSNTRAGLASGIKTMNNSMSGFCSSCHGYFHSSGGGDYVDNGVSGAFLRHPSDYVIPNSGEYAAYTVYDPTAPVSRPSVFSQPGQSVRPGTDMVGCLSCHVAHGSANDYLLRFDYATMTAGSYGTIPDAQAVGGCLACHTTKGVLPQNR